MDIESLLAQYTPFLKKYWLPIALFLLGLIFFVYGLISFLGSASKQQGITFKNTDSASDSAPTSISQNSILVDVEGAVASPGVYKLAQNSIIKDALVSSGGLSESADRDFVSKNINLAAKLYDGAKIYIPKVGETAQISNSNNQITDSNGSILNLININTASSDSLDSLPGVGPATAGKIINGRPYTKPQDLLDKKVVSSKVFDGIKDKISVY